MMSTPATQPSQDLRRARASIDALDDELLSLIERRFRLSLQIATLKQDDGDLLKIRPRREAEVLARLAARATTATPELIAHVWRELMAHSVQAQVQTKLIMHAPGASADLGDRVRERFGRAAPLILVETPEEALNRAREGQAIAVVGVGQSNWWVQLAEEKELTIFDSIDAQNGLVLLIGRIAASDVAPGRAIRVVGQHAGDLLAHAGGRYLCRVPDEQGDDPPP